MSWPVAWPDPAVPAAAGPALQKLAELYAVACLTALTLQRVGGAPVTIMPSARCRGHWLHWGYLDGMLVGAFYPGTVYPSAEDLKLSFTAESVEALDLPGPVGAIVEVRVGGVVLDPLAYRVENGRYLVRLDGGVWPVNSGDDFTVTYYNSHPVDEIGEHAAGVLAAEWLKLLTNTKGCRLPSSVTNVSRQGLTFEVARGMFPDGLSGLPEVDAYLMLWNPFGLKVAPRVYSLDLPVHRQVWNA